MNKRIFGTFIALALCVGGFAQGTHSFKLSEVVTCNKQGLIDEYGQRSAWVEVENTSWGTYNLRNCYLTNNRKALDEDLSVPDREAIMSLIPKGDARTNLTAKTQLVFFADGFTNRGTVHASFKLDPTKPNFIALFDGNGRTLIDSVTVPVLPADCSYARLYNKDTNTYEWKIQQAAQVTPNSSNKVEGKVENKVQEFKQRDPYGIAMSIIAMGIVFICLILLYVFFRVLGIVLHRIDVLTRVKAIKAIREQAHKVTVIAKQGLETKGIDNEVYVAVIALALQEYEENVHDIESNVLTIVPDDRSAWHNEVPENPSGVFVQ
jgi:Na+-transporting methylmalonyl-CoA/oxaloacetate decarboxylase gamma subunit